MPLQLEPDAEDAHARVPLPVARWADRVFDWLEEEPINVQARRHAFTNGLWAVTAQLDGEGWLILWEQQGPDLVVHYLGENTLDV